MFSFSGSSVIEVSMKVESYCVWIAHIGLAERVLTLDLAFVQKWTLSLTFRLKSDASCFLCILSRLSAVGNRRSFCHFQNGIHNAVCSWAHQVIACAHGIYGFVCFVVVGRWIWTRTSQNHAPDCAASCWEDTSVLLSFQHAQSLSLIHIWRCRRLLRCRSRWSPYH